MAEVWLKVKNDRISLEPNSILEDLAESPSVVTVMGGDETSTPLLDGRALSVVQRDPQIAVAEISLVNDAGYHEVFVWKPGRVVPQVYAFCTKQASRKASMVRRMVDCLDEVGWSPRDLTLQGTCGPRPERVPGVILGWMSERIAAVVEAASAIVRRPVPVQCVRRQVQGYMTRLDLPSTLTLLRSKPEFLSEREQGQLKVGSKIYSPEFVVDKRASQTLDTVEHGQLADFLSWLCRDITWLRDNERLASYASSADRWLHDLATLGRNTFIASVTRRPRGESRTTSPTSLQRQDWRYRSIRSLHVEYQSLRGYMSSDDEMRTFLESADKIFEVFCCHLIAQAFGLSLCGRSIKERVQKRSFSGPAGDLYYNVIPPSSLLRSWRDESVCKDHDRPDILLRIEGRGLALLDCKFKDYTTGSLTDDVREMQAYQHSYGLTSSALLCPFGNSVYDVAGGKYLVRVIPLRPVQPHDLPDMLSYVRQSVGQVVTQTSG